MSVVWHAAEKIFSMVHLKQCIYLHKARQKDDEKGQSGERKEIKKRKNRWIQLKAGGTVVLFHPPFLAVWS